VRVAKFDLINLEMLFPSLSLSETDRLIAAAARLDVIRPGGTRSGWDWFAEHTTQPLAKQFGTPVVLSTEIVLDDHGSDLLELNFDIGWSDPPERLRVFASTNIACFCAQDHGCQLVRQAEWLVGPADAMADAVDEATALLVEWAEDSHDAGEHRRRAGLPR
jgi:hypothetical protein